MCHDVGMLMGALYQTIGCWLSLLGLGCSVMSPWPLRGTAGMHAHCSVLWLCPAAKAAHRHSVVADKWRCTGLTPPPFPSPLTGNAFSTPLWCGLTPADNLTATG